MNKKLLIGAVATATVGCAAAAAAKKQGSATSESKPTVWEKMKEGMEQMPEDFPARIMYDNIETIKANTEDILALLRDRAAQQHAEQDRAELTSSS